MGDREREEGSAGDSSGIGGWSFGELGAMLFRGSGRLAVDMDLCERGVTAAWSLSYEAGGTPPQVLVVTPEDYHWAEMIVARLAGEQKLLSVIVLTSLPRGMWVVGDPNNPGCFYGSPGI